MTLSPDFDLAHADWPKKTWDLPLTVPGLVWALTESFNPSVEQVNAELAALMARPVGRAMPQPLRRALEQWGYTVEVAPLVELKHGDPSRPDYRLKHPGKLRPKAGRVSSSFPTAKVAERARERRGADAPKRITLDHIPDEMLPKVLERQAQVPGFEDLEGRDDRAALDVIVERQSQNILDLVRQSFRVDREGALAHAAWYGRANQMGRDWAEQNDFHPDSVYAVMAVLSPGADWADNVAWAKHITEQVANERNIQLDPRVMSHLHGIRLESYEAALAAASDKSRVRVPEEIRLKPGQKTLADLDEITAGMYIRAAVDREGKLHQIGGPGLGRSTDVAIPNKYLFLGKAVSVLRDGSRNNIDRQLGSQEKVRSFYNNIRDPDDRTFEDVTVDTHHFGAANGIPWGLSSPFISSGSRSITSNPSSAATGAHGTYPLVVEATRRAAARFAREEPDLDLRPNQIQSVAWEMHRALFPSVIRREKLGFLEFVGQQRSAAQRGEITRDEMYRRIEERRLEIREAKERSRRQKRKDPNAEVRTLDQIAEQWRRDAAGVAAERRQR